jgi:hypothetical protein
MVRVESLGMNCGKKRVFLLLSTIVVGACGGDLGRPPVDARPRDVAEIPDAAIRDEPAKEVPLPDSMAPVLDGGIDLGTTDAIADAPPNIDAVRCIGHIDPSPATGSFSAAVGSMSEPQAFTINNYGSAPFGPIAAEMTSGSFVISENTCDSVLPPRASCRVAVVFFPSEPGYFAGVLKLYFEDCVGRVPLAGQAYAPPPVGVDAGDAPSGVALDGSEGRGEAGPAAAVDGSIDGR